MICIKQVERKIIEPLASSSGNRYFLSPDERVGTVHVAYFDDDESVVGCLSMSVTAKACFDAIPQYKIDGIAVAKNKQNQGVGFALVKMAEFIALNNQVGCVWIDNCNSAVDYFKKQGYAPLADDAKVLVKYPEDHCCSSCADCAQNTVCGNKHV